MGNPTPKNYLCFIYWPFILAFNATAQHWGLERVRGCAGDNLLTREPRLAFNICLVMSRRLPLIVGVAWHGNLWNCIVAVLGSLCGCNLIKRLPQTEAPPEGHSGRPRAGQLTRWHPRVRQAVGVAGVQVGTGCESPSPTGVSCMFT